MKVSFHCSFGCRLCGWLSTCCNDLHAVSPECTGRNLNPQGGRPGEGDDEAATPGNRISVLMKEPAKGSVFPPVEDQWRNQYLQPERGPSPEPNHAGTPVSGFQPLER